MEPENSNDQSFLANHRALLAIAILLAGGLYLFFGNTTTALVSVIGLVLAHIAVVTGVLLLARGRLGKAFRKLLGSSTSQNQQ
jgi:hypothetical protein